MFEIQIAALAGFIAGLLAAHVFGASRSTEQKARTFWDDAEFVSTAVEKPKLKGIYLVQYPGALIGVYSSAWWDGKQFINDRDDKPFDPQPVAWAR